MNSERDYSVRLPVGTPEISGFQTVTNRKDQQRKRRPAKDKHEPARDEDAVEVDLAEQPDEADQTPPADAQEPKPARPGGVDHLA